jgi:hypothetical protein
MSWDRTPVAKALVVAITAELEAQAIEAAVLDRPVYSVNPDAIVIGRPSEVRYGAAAFGIDEANLPVLCLAGPEQDDTVTELIGVVRAACDADMTLGGVVQYIDCTGERAWRSINVGGADYLGAEAQLLIQM